MDDSLSYNEISVKNTEKLSNKKLKLLGENIKKLRLKNKLTQADLAFYIHSDKSLISSLETGVCKNITFTSIMKLIIFFNINLEDLFKENN